MFQHYLDAFDAGQISPCRRQRVAGIIVPTLVRALEGVGLTPMISHDLGCIADIQSKNSEKMRLFQPFNPALQIGHGAKDAVVLTLQRGNQQVACAATRLLWIGESLALDMQSLRLFYADVRGMSRPGETCIVTAPSAKKIGDCHVGLTGAVFVPHGEDPVVVRAMMRLLHLWVFAHWKWSWLMGIAERPAVRGYAYDIYGYPSAELGVWREGREYMLLVAPRRYYEERVDDASFHDLTASLGQPTQHATINAQQIAESARAGEERAA
jgi:hypothetical protein